MSASTQSGSEIITNSQVTGKRSKRNTNFTSAEDEVLLSEVENRSSILNSKHNSMISHKRKQTEWKEIAAAVSVVSTQSRSTVSIQGRFKNLKARSKNVLGTKLNIKSANKTGGGPAAELLTSAEERMLGIIGETAVRGVTGGYDTSSSTVQTVAAPATSKLNYVYAYKFIWKYQLILNYVYFEYYSLTDILYLNLIVTQLVPRIQQPVSVTASTSTGNV